MNSMPYWEEEKKNPALISTYLHITPVCRVFLSSLKCEIAVSVRVRFLLYVFVWTLNHWLFTDVIIHLRFIGFMFSLGLLALVTFTLMEILFKEQLSVNNQKKTSQTFTLFPRKQKDIFLNFKSTPVVTDRDNRHLANGCLQALSSVVQ